MAIDTITPRSRRALLAGTLGGAVALVAGALGRPLPGQAADGDVIHVGDDLTGTRATTITSEGDGFVGVTTDYGGNATAGVRGHATLYSRGAFGVDGTSASPDGVGVRGWAMGYTGRNQGVYGNSDSDEGIGVLGDVSASSGPTRGVVGASESTEGIGVAGFVWAGSATGVMGVCGNKPEAEPFILPTAGVWGVAHRDDGRGGVFGGPAAQVRLEPASTTHPVSGLMGDLFADTAGRLWFCKGGSGWKQIA